MKNAVYLNQIQVPIDMDEDIPEAGQIGEWTGEVP